MYVLVSMAVLPNAVLAQQGVEAAADTIVIENNVMVAMRDGVRLSTDSYRPAKPGRYPVILFRDAYGNGSGESSGARKWVDNGYVYIRPDVRGRYGSEGNYYPYINEINDGYDTQQWAGSQPWSSGEPPVRIFVTGENRWRSESQWPLKRTRSTKYYLHSGGKANMSAGDGRLEARPPASGQPDTYTYDPANPVPAVGGNLLPVSLGAGPADQTEVAKRDDVPVFTTHPLQKDTEVTGPISVTLYAASSAPDTDFTAKLVDVHPDGKAYNLADGIIRARYRESIENPTLIEPGNRCTSPCSTFGPPATCSSRAIGFGSMFPAATFPFRQQSEYRPRVRRRRRAEERGADAAPLGPISISHHADHSAVVIRRDKKHR